MEWRAANREKYLAIQRIDEKKKERDKLRRADPEQRERENLRNKAMRDDLHTTYIIQRIRADFGLQEIPPPIIELKRERLRLHRAIRTAKDVLKQEKSK